MLGLFGTLNLGARALQTQQKGAEVAGHNLANIQTPGYARQRLVVQTSGALETAAGWQGTGVQGEAVMQLRNELLDRQLLGETSLQQSLATQQEALEQLEARVGERVQRQAATSSTDGAGSGGLSQSLTQLFNAFQAVSASPASDIERDALVNRASSVAAAFRNTADAVTAQQSALDEEVQKGVEDANRLLGEIGRLDERIRLSEFEGERTAHDLRDLRQQKLEELSKFVRFDAAEARDGTLNLSVGGVTLLSDGAVTDTLATVTRADGHLVVATAANPAPLPLTAGRLHGLMAVRDGAAQQALDDANRLASALISEVNRLHRPGFALDGSTGADFFTGTDATSIQVNAALKANPSLIQAASVPGAEGDNTVALALARLANEAQPALGGRTFTQACHRSVAALGEQLVAARAERADQDAVVEMLVRQQESVSGVSLDEELTDLTRYQKAFAASAKLVTTVSEMLDEVIAMKR